jgi:hypothetical protein
MGLTGEAEVFLDKNCVTIPSEKCPHCDGVIRTTKEVVFAKQHDSFYGDGPTLHTYKLKNGGTVTEVIQAEPWSSGPVCFLCLELEDGTKICQWDEEEIKFIL